MNAAALAEFQSRGNTVRAATFGKRIKVDGVDKTAVFSSPRLDSFLAESTVRVDRYTSTLRILATEVPHLTTAAQWLDEAIEIQLPDGTGFRTYRILKDVMPVLNAGEWRIELETV